MARTKRKGLGGGGLSLLQHYCPFCFKGKIGVSSGLCVSRGSKLIDEVQAMHARKGNGLCPIDFKSPGEFCENQEFCKLACLVCGQATVHGTDPEFELFLQLFCEETHAITLRYEINDAMAKYDLAWTEAWDTPVHARCCKKTVCKCVVPVGTTVCPVHKRQLDREPVSMLQTRKPRPSPLVIPTFQPPVPAAESCKKAPAGAMPRAPAAAVERASWLPSPTARTRAQAVLDLPPADSRRVEPVSKKRPAPAPKPNANTKRALLEASAESCKFKINDWSNAAVTWEGREQQPEQKASDGWSLALHNRTFDPALHGYREVNGVYGYRRAPDGKFIPTQATVNTLNPDGTMTPLVDMEHHAPPAAMAPPPAKPRVTVAPTAAKQVASAKRAWMEAAGKECRFKIHQAFGRK
jgi:hypothetical protein